MADVVQWGRKPKQVQISIKNPVDHTERINGIQLELVAGLEPATY